MLRPISAATALAVLWLAMPAAAQVERVPSNPFASNYPSAPPQPVVVEHRELRPVRTRRVRRAPPPEVAPQPPGLAPD